MSALTVLKRTYLTGFGSQTREGKMYVEEAFIVDEWDHQMEWKLREKNFQNNEPSFACVMMVHQDVINTEFTIMNKLLEVVDPWD